MIGLVQIMAVYTEAAGGLFSVLAAAAVPCRLARMARLDQVGEYRAQDARTKNLMWESYALPEHCEVEIDGERWTPEVGPRNDWHGPNGQIHHHSVMVTRVETG